MENVERCYSGLILKRVKRTNHFGTSSVTVHRPLTEVASLVKPVKRWYVVILNASNG